MTSTSSTSDSEDEAEMRPSFSNPSATMCQEFEVGMKRPAFVMAAYGDAGNGEDSAKAPRPGEFLKEKVPVDVAASYSNKSRNMMQKMGFKEGGGLGKHGQGRTEIIETSKQKGRKGLGAAIPGLGPSDIDWNFDKEQIVDDEEVDWLPSYSGSLSSLEEMMSWKEVGPKKEFIDDETQFCSEEALHLVINGKNVFDDLEPEEMRRARTRSNPYETIRGAFFLNRAAMKMANIDAMFDFMFTNAMTEGGKPVRGSSELLYFADICAGPGGFSEYVLWRTKGESKGFGMTLKTATNDFTLENFYAGPPEMFEPHYGENGIEGDGDIFRPKNQSEFTKFVLKSTDNKGVHFVMADGGFSVEGSENLQEVLSKQLYLCQFLVAVSILRPGGHFVCKLFDLFTPFSVGLIYLMNMIFEKTTIIKPVTSRPANSERYIVCKSMKAERDNVLKYMQSINEDLCEYSSSVSSKSIQHIVPLATLTGDEEFFSYMVNSNDKLARLQAVHLKKIEVFAQNSSLYEGRQAEVRSNCLKKWKIPNEVRVAPGRVDTQAVFKELIPESDREMFRYKGSTLTRDNLDMIKCASSYICQIRGEGDIFYLLGCGRSKVSKWEGRPGSNWHSLENNFHVELPNKTLLEVQSVFVYIGEGKGQMRRRAIQVFDAFYLCGEDVRKLSFEKRHEKLRKFIKAIHKPTRSNLTQLFLADVFPLEKIENIFNNLTMRAVKGSGSFPRLCYSSSSGNFFLPNGVNIIQSVREPWIKNQSKSTGRMYWFNIHDKRSVYECPPESIATIRDCKKDLLTWPWTEGVKVHPDQQKENTALLSRSHFSEHLKKLRQK